jgi:hypothetical protein
VNLFLNLLVCPYCLRTRFGLPHIVMRIFYGKCADWTIG